MRDSSPYLYKGYQAKFEVDIESDHIFVSVENAPKIHNMTDAETVSETKVAFNHIIDEYLAACKAEGWAIERPLVLTLKP